MAYSYIKYTGDGSQTDFTFAFAYFDTSHVHVLVDGIDVDFVWLNAQTIQCVTAPAAGTTVVVMRNTPKEEPPVDFTDGSILLERDLDTLVLYNLYISQEAIDQAQLGIQQNALGQWDAKELKIVNLADGVEPGDAINKGQLDYEYPAVKTVADNMPAVVTVSQNIPVITEAATLVPHAAAIDTVANNLTDIHSFKDTYFIGPTTPTQAVTLGDLWFDSANNRMMVFGNGGWMAAGSSINGTSNRSVQVLTEGQTLVSGFVYDSIYLDVYLNGNKLNPLTDFTAETGSSITLTEPAHAGDVIDCVAYGTFAVVRGAGGSTGWGGTPIGTIAMWSGQLTNIPQGWMPCDGIDGRPDLRNRFVVGAGDLYAAGSTGGFLDASLPTHQHTLVGGPVTGTGSTDSVGDHSHTYNAYPGDGAQTGWSTPGGAAQPTFNPSGATSSTGAHSHTVTVTIQGGVTGMESSGVDPTGKNLPPYYALMYIIKITGDLTDGPTGPQGPVGPAGASAVTGAIQHFALRTAPTGWLAADGSAVSRTDYAALYTAMGDTFGAGDGSSTFNLPNLIGKFLQGVSGDAVGTTGGSANAVVVSHSHDVAITDPGHSHAQWCDSDMDGNANGGPRPARKEFQNTEHIVANTTGITASATAAGEDGTGKNIPPYVGLLPCIKT